MISKKRRFALWGFGGLAVLSPLAVVIACGETKSAPTPAPTPGTTETPVVVPPKLEATGLAWQPGSKHTNITWVGAVRAAGPEAPNYVPVEYLSGAYPTNEAAQQATTWGNALPIEVAFDAKSRYLWARIRPATGKTGAPIYLDLTAISKIQTVPSDVDAVPALAELKSALEAATITGTTLNELELNVPPVPADLPLAFQVQINDKPWINADAFNGVISTFANTYKLNDPLAIKARLQLTGDPVAFLFTAPPVRDLDVSEIKLYLQSGASLYDENFSAAASVSHDQLTYTGTVIVIGADRSNYGPVEYLTGNYPTRAAAEAATTWSTALPKTTSFAWNERFFWVRALPLPTAPTTSQPLYANITGDISSADNYRSGIRAVKANVNVMPAYANVTLSQLALGGTSLSDMALTGMPDLAAVPLGLELQINDGAWFKVEALSTQLVALRRTYTRGAPLAIKVRLVLVDPDSLYVFTPPTPMELDTTSLRAALEKEVVVNASTLRVDTNASTHDRLVWLSGAMLEGLGATNFVLEYLASEVTTVTAASRASGWSPDLPTSTSFTPSTRYLYVRLRPLGANSGLPTKVEDVTAISELRNVKGNVNVLPEYTAASLADINLVSYQPPADDPTAPRQLKVENVPQFSTLPVVTEISFSGGSWAVASDNEALTKALLEFIDKRADLNERPSFYARFALKADAPWAMLKSESAYALSISDAFRDDLYDAAPTIEVDLSSIMDAAWSPFVVSDGAWPVKNARGISAAEREQYKARWDDAPMQEKLESLTGDLKAAVVGFDTLNIRRPASNYTVADIAGIADTPDYKDDNLFNWRWEDERDDWQWTPYNSLTTEQVSSLWARVRLANTKKFVAKQTPIWNIDRPSRYAFANNSFWRGHTPITKAEFDEANDFLHAMLNFDAANSKSNTINFLPINAPIPLALREGRIVVRLFLRDEQILAVFIITDWNNLPQVSWPRSATIRSLQVLMHGTRLDISGNTESSSVKTYLPASLLDIQNDLSEVYYGPMHVVKTWKFAAAS